MDCNWTLKTTALKDAFKGWVVCLSHSWGGLEQVAVHDTLDAAAAGLDMKFLCLEGSPVHEQIAHSKVPVVALNIQPRNTLDWKFKSILDRGIGEGVNLIHTHQPSLLGSLAPWLWQHRHVALLATRHILNDHSKKDLVHRALYSRVDYLMVMSRALRKNVLKTHAISPKKVKIVHLGLNFEAFDPEKVNPMRQRALWGADEKTKVIGLVGRIDPAKGQATFIQAAAGLLRNFHSDFSLKFVIVGEETLGSSSDYLVELKRMVAQFRLEKVIVFAGYQKNIPEVMRSFDIFVMPSRQETFGLVAIEAMAMECPIILSSGGSADEILGENPCGLTMKPNDAFDLQRQLRYLLEHPAERVQMGQRARLHVRALYDRERRLSQTLDLYAFALKRRGVIP